MDSYLESTDCRCGEGKRGGSSECFQCREKEKRAFKRKTNALKHSMDQNIKKQRFSQARQQDVFVAVKDNEERFEGVENANRQLLQTSQEVGAICAKYAHNPALQLASTAFAGLQNGLNNFANPLLHTQAPALQNIPQAQPNIFGPLAVAAQGPAIPLQNIPHGQPNIFGGALAVAAQGATFP